MATTYVALLRAVNVGGRVVKMERLRGLFEDLGCTDVRTFIQSGNVRFTTTRRSRPALARDITAHLTSELGYDVPVVLRTPDEIAHALALDPFRGVEVTPETRLCIAFVAGPVPADLDLPLVSPKGDVRVLGVTDAEAFVVLTHPPGRAANPGPVLDRALGAPSTLRFWHTTQKLLAAFTD